MRRFEGFRLFDLLRFCGLVTLLFIVFLISGCKEAKHTKNIVAMDTVITLTAVGENGKEANDAAVEFVEKLDKTIGFNEDSELTKLNKEASESFVEVSPEVLELIKLGEYYSDFTKGTYNPYAGKLVGLWDRARENETLPTKEEIENAKKTLDNKPLIKTGKVKKSKTSAELTFGGIAKGYAADIVYSLYKEFNVTGFLNFGTSTILACGEKSYRVGIKNPRDEEKLLGVIIIKNAALSTSGDYERYFIKDGVRYHHIIDPNTGYPANSSIASATVIVPLSYDHAGAMSDALSTALVVMGKDGVSVLPKDIGAVLVTTDGEVIEVNGARIERE